MSEDMGNDGREAVRAIEELRLALWNAFAEIRALEGLEINDGRLYEVCRANMDICKDMPMQDGNMRWDGMLKGLLSAAERARRELAEGDAMRWEDHFTKQFRGVYRRMEGMRPSAREQHCADLVMGLAYCAVMALDMWIGSTVSLTLEERFKILSEVGSRRGGEGDGEA